MEVQENKIIDEAVKSVGNLLKLAYNFAQSTDVLMSSIALRLRRFGGMKTRPTGLTALSRETLRRRPAANGRSSTDTDRTPTN